MSDEKPNEIIAAAQDAKARAASVKDRRGRRQLGAIGLGLGIGSAAVAAAVLYANRTRDDD